MTIYNQCTKGGDISNNCKDCVYSTDYHYDEESGLCLEDGYKYDRKTNQIVKVSN